MKKLCSVLLIAMMLLMALVPMAGAEEADTIVIGGLAPLTGEVSYYGNGVFNGASIAVEEINAAGGVLGKQITYVNYDEKGDPTEAINAYNRLFENDKIVALMGDVTTKPTLAVAEIAAQDGIPMITPTGTGAEITQIGDNIFRACFTDPFQGEVMANYAQEVLGAQSCAILFDTSDDYSSGIADAFEETATALGMTVTAKEGYPSGNADFNAQLTKIKTDEPDVILASCYYEDAAKIITQADALGIASTFLGPDGWSGVLDQLGDNASVIDGNYYLTQYSDADPSEGLQKFMEAYQARTGEKESMFAVLGYEGVYILANAIENAGTTESEAVIEAIRNLEYEGLNGMISFRGGQDPARAAYMVQFEGGQEVMLGAYSLTE